MEKRRRARINESLGQLKTLILDALKKDVSIHLSPRLLIDLQNPPRHTARKRVRNPNDVFLSLTIRAPDTLSWRRRTSWRWQWSIFGTFRGLKWPVSNTSRPRACVFVRVRTRLAVLPLALQRFMDNIDQMNRALWAFDKNTLFSLPCSCLKYRSFCPGKISRRFQRVHEWSHQVPVHMRRCKHRGQDAASRTFGQLHDPDQRHELSHSASAPAPDPNSRRTHTPLLRPVYGADSQLVPAGPSHERSVL